MRPSSSLVIFFAFLIFGGAKGNQEHPLSKIAVHRATLASSGSVSVKVSPIVLGLKVLLPLSLTNQGFKS